MRRSIVVVAAALLAGACSGAVDQQQEAALLLDRDRAWVRTVRSVDTYMTYLAPNATIYPPGAPMVTGVDAIRAMAADRLTAGVAMSWTPTSASVSASGDLGYTVGTYTTSAGASAEKGKYLTIWRKHDGSWKVVEDIFNTDSAGPATAPPTTGGDAGQGVKP